MVVNRRLGLTRSCIQSPSCTPSTGAAVSCLTSDSTTGRQRARLGLSGSPGSILVMSPNSWSFASVADLMPAPRNKRKNCVTGSYGRTREHLFNLSVVTGGCNVDAAWHTPVPSNENVQDGLWIATVTEDHRFFQHDRKRQATPRWFSRGGKSLSVPATKSTSLQNDWFHDVALFWARPFAVVVYFICVFCCVWPQRTSASAWCKTHLVPRFREPTLA